jgi:predicted nuclease with RNAse H fold
MTARTVGIDLASRPERTAVCTIDWLPNRQIKVCFADKQSDQDLVDLIVDAAQDRTKVGIDCPLGWPKLFVETVTAHFAGHRLPDEPALLLRPASRQRRKRLDPPAPLDQLLYRLTDERTRNVTGSRPPLSVSANLLGVVALRCARILNAVEAAGIVVDRSGQTGVVAEVYPAATLRQWKLSGLISYKQPAARAARESIVKLLEQKLDMSFAPAVADRCTASHDALDALIAAFAARAAALCMTIRPSDVSADAQRLAPIEGWIHLPTCQPADLLG